MEQITEDYVSFEVAKLLKEKGFNVLTRDYYRITGSGPFGYEDPQNWNDDRVNETAGGMTYVSCPTQALVIKWLRIKHNIHISIQTFGEEKDYPRYLYQVCELKDYKCSIENALKELQMDYEDILLISFKTPEEATEAAILYCLQNLIK